MTAVQISPKVYWVGAIDWKLRNFHGYSTDKGSTYNAYLILADKVTLIDNVKAGFTDEILKRISSVVDPSKIEIIISNHSEPDHSGSLPALLKAAPNATLYASTNGKKILEKLYSVTAQEVKSGDTLDLGGRSLTFLHTPMVHWPDNMLSYCPEEKILFSNDAFGQHYASSARFDKDCDLSTVLHEAKKYFANIVLPYCPQVKAALGKAAELSVNTIAPSHGIIWQKNIGDIMNMYRALSDHQKQQRAVIVYDTMWHSTERIANAIADGFLKADVEVHLCDLQNNHISDIITLLCDATYLAVGSPTINNQILPTLASFLCYLKGLAPQGLKTVTFGSYGWGGQSVGIIEEHLQALKYEALCPSFKIQYAPDEKTLNDIAQNVFQSI